MHIGFVLCLIGYLVPETAWIRHFMRFQSQYVFGHDWTETDALRPSLRHIVEFPHTPPYFRTPLHGFLEGGVCREQALQQASSMRYIMHMFQCDPLYREVSFELVIPSLPISKDGIAIDIGCGSGDSTLALKENLPNHSVFGIDLSRAMTKLARRRTKLPFITADAANMPLQNESVAIVTAFALLHEMPRGYSRIVLRECARVIQSGGFIVLWDQNPELPTPQSTAIVPIEPFLDSYKSMNVTKELDRAGFHDIRVQTNRFMRLWIAKKRKL